MNFKFKKYWRKTGLNPKWGNKLIELVNQKKPNHFLEIGVFCGVTSRNICEFLNLIHNGNFTYTGIDLFSNESEDNNEKKPAYIKTIMLFLRKIYPKVYRLTSLNSSSEGVSKNQTAKVIIAHINCIGKIYQFQPKIHFSNLNG